MSDEVEKMIKNYKKNKDEPKDTRPSERTIPSWETDWEGDSMWFNCPYCGERVCAGWFYGKSDSCAGCSRRIDVEITVYK